MSNTFAIVLIALAGLLLLVLAAASLYMYRTAVVRKRNHSVTVWDSEELMKKITAGHAEYSPLVGERTAWLCTAGASDRTERLTVTSHDGLRLTARLIPCPEGVRQRGIMLMMHGYRSNPVFDFGGSARVINNMGFALCLPDQRAHGGSEGRYLTYGVKERHDTAAWCQLLSEKFPEVPIILVGISMGASTVMGATSLELPTEVKGAVADCGYVSPDAIFRKVLRFDFKLPSFPIYSITRVIIKLFAGFGVHDLSCADELARRHLPVLVVHGTGDKFVPYSMGEENRDGAALSPLPHIFLPVEGAGHGKSFLIDEKAYTEALERLLEICEV